MQSGGGRRGDTIRDRNEQAGRGRDVKGPEEEDKKLALDVLKWGDSGRIQRVGEQGVPVVKVTDKKEDFSSCMDRREAM